MADKGHPKIVRALKEMMRARGISPEKIVIFGSRAGRRPGEMSDLDIVIVSRDFEGKDIFERIEMSRGLHEDLVDRLMIPVDILYCSPSEWKKGTSIILSLAREEGLIYA